MMVSVLLYPSYLFFLRLLRIIFLTDFIYFRENARRGGGEEGEEQSERDKQALC